MSKLSDRIRKVTRLQPAPLGFGAARSAPEPTMLLAGLAKDAQAAAELRRRGADVVIVGSPDRAAPREPLALENAVVGAGIAGKDDDEAKAYREASYDFVVFDPNKASATALLDEVVGYVAVLPHDLSDSELRTLESFGLDALDIGQVSGALTARRLIDLRRIYAMTRKPLMARVEGNISGPMLQALRDANVVIVAAERPDDVERLRKAIDALPPRSRGKAEDRPTPLVPHATAAGEDHEHDDDDD